MLGRRLAVAAISVACLPTAAFGLAPIAASTTVIFAGGTGGSLGKLVPDGIFGNTDSLLGGAYKDDAVSVLDYPSALWPVTGLLDPTMGASIETGAANLVGQAKSAPGPLILAGTSQGAMVVQHAAAILDDDPGFSTQTTVIVIADPNLGLFSGSHGVKLPILDYTPEPLPETRFNTVVVVNQYDGWADPIADPGNLLTVLNAVMGLVYIHPYAQNSDLSAVPQENITTSSNSRGGLTTTYLVPTQRLPLTMPLRQLSVPDEIVDRIDEALRPIIDAGYDRPGRARAALVPAAASRSDAMEPREIRPIRSTESPHPPRAARFDGQATHTPGNATLKSGATASVRPADSSSPRGATGTSARRSRAR